MSLEWFFAIVFALGGLFSGYVNGHWDGLGQAFIGLMGAMLLGMLVERRTSEAAIRKIRESISNQRGIE